MIRKTLAVLGITLLCLTTAAFSQDTESSQEQIAELQEEVKDLEKRLMKTERKAALDRVNFSGDYRFEAHSTDATFPDYFDGMQLQRALDHHLRKILTPGLNGRCPLVQVMKASSMQKIVVVVVDKTVANPKEDVEPLPFGAKVPVCSQMPLTQ